MSTRTPSCGGGAICGTIVESFLCAAGDSRTQLVKAVSATNTGGHRVCGLKSSNMGCESGSDEKAGFVAVSSIVASRQAAQ